MYEISQIQSILSNLSGRQLIHYVSNTILNEPKKEIISDALEVLGRDEFCNSLYKTLSIINNGGMVCKETNKQKTNGGIFCFVIKSESNLNKKELKKIFNKDYNYRNQKRKIKLMLDTLNIEESNKLTSK